MDATGKNNNLQSERGYADHKVKLLRKEKHASNQNRLGSKNLNSEKANNKLKKYIKCIYPYIASLPDHLLHEPGSSLASAVLTKAIICKHKQEVLRKSSESENHIPTSARINFKLWASQNIINFNTFKELDNKTQTKTFKIKP